MESFVRHEGSEVHTGPYEAIEDGNKATVCKIITNEDITLLCEAVGLDLSSIDLHQLQPLLQILAAGAAWTAVSRLLASGCIQVSGHLDFATPVEVGDIITAVAWAEERTNHGLLNIRLTSRNQRGELVLEAVLEM